MMNSASGPFKIVGVSAIVVGGVIAATNAYRASEPIMWMVAYLVLVAGVVQYILGAGQRRLLAGQALNFLTVSGQCFLMNLGNVGVIVGTLCSSAFILISGTVFYAISLLWLMITTRKGSPILLLSCYWIIAIAMLVSSVVGLFLSPLLG